MGKVFIEDALRRTGIGRTTMPAVLTYLIRTGKATGQDDAIKRLESGEFDGADFDELIISSYQKEKPVAEIEEETEEEE